MELDDLINKKKAIVLSIMIDSRLIWCKHYFPWCDEIIVKYEKPPYWIIELGLEKCIAKAASIVREYVYSEPFVEMDKGKLADLYIACMILKYLRKQISWATFLEEAGNLADGTQGTKKCCEYFYMLLSSLEDAEFDYNLEKKQYESIEKLYKYEIEEIHGYYESFKKYL